MTVTGKTAGENTASAVVWNEKVIRPLDRPRLPNGGLCILRGNLAPEGAVIKARPSRPRTGDLWVGPGYLTARRRAGRLS